MTTIAEVQALWQAEIDAARPAPTPPLTIDELKARADELMAQIEADVAAEQASQAADSAAFWQRVTRPRET
jgi:hypothetical protein